MKSNRTNVVIFIAALILCWWWIYSKNSARSQDSNEQPLLAQAEEQVASGLQETDSTDETQKPSPTPQETPKVAMNPEQVESLRAFAKGSLSAAYTAQRAYYAEFNRYTTDLEATGWQPIDPMMKFKMGFLEEFIAPEASLGPAQENPRYMNTDNFVNREAGLGSNDQPYFFKYAPEAEYINLDQFGSYCRQGCTASEKDFEMVLVLPLGDNKHDVWLINSDKQMELVQDGTK